MGKPKGQECLRQVCLRQVCTGLCEFTDKTGGLKFEELVAWFGITGVRAVDVRNLQTYVCIGCARTFLPSEFRNSTAKELEVRKGVVR